MLSQFARKVASWALLCIPITLTPNIVKACEETYPVDFEQAREQIQILQSPNAEEFDQIVAFETLACAERISIRTQAYKIARKANSEVVRAEVLRKYLFDLPRIVIHYRFDEPLTSEQRRIMERDRSFSYNVKKRIPDSSCIALYNSDCSSRALHQFGNKLQIFWNVNDTQIDMELNRDGRLVGEVIWDSLRESGIAPLPIEMRMP